MVELSEMTLWEDQGKVVNKMYYWGMGQGTIPIIVIPADMEGK